MLYRAFLLLVLLISALDVEADYRDEEGDCNGSDCYQDNQIRADNYVGYTATASARHSNPNKKKKMISKRHKEEVPDIVAAIPTFQLSMGLKSDLTNEQSVENLDEDLMEILLGYFDYMDKPKKPYLKSVHLEKTASIIEGGTFISTFTGNVTINGERAHAFSDITTMIDKYFHKWDDWFGYFVDYYEEDGEDGYIYNYYKESAFTGDFEFSFVTDEENSGKSESIPENQDEEPVEIENDEMNPPTNEDIDDEDDDTSGNYEFDLVDDTDAYNNDPTTETNEFIDPVTTEKTTDSSKFASANANMLIVASTVLIAAVALFSYAYRRHNVMKGYSLSGDDHERDLESQATPPGENAEVVVKSLGLSDIAATTPAHTGKSYLGAAANAWTAARRSMSDLAAGATQEEFFKNGMNIHVYGSHDKKKRKAKKGSPRSSEMEPLDAIVEVDSSLSGTGTDTESWQNGDKQINNAPPLLPALSVSSNSSAPSDETPLNDIRNMSEDFESPAPPSEDYNLPFSTPFKTPQEGAIGINSMMTPYADMTGIRGSPDLISSSDSSNDGVPLDTMRCLSFDGAKSVSDFSSSDQSSQSSIKDMLEAADSKMLSSSTDDKVEDKVTADDVTPEEPIELLPEINEIKEKADLDQVEGQVNLALKSDKVQPIHQEVGSKSAESIDLSYSDDEKSFESKEASMDLTYSDDENTPMKREGEGTLQDIGLEEIDLFCPPEIKSAGKLVMNDPVSGITANTDDADRAASASEENVTNNVSEAEAENVSEEITDTESVTSLITVENK